jgi:hypothetical protein
MVCVAGVELRAAAEAMVGKLTLKNGSYEPDSYPNPGTSVNGCDGWSMKLRQCIFWRACAALAMFWAQLEAKAFQEEFDVATFEDVGEPQWDKIHKVRMCSGRCSLGGRLTTRRLGSACGRVDAGVEEGAGAG